MSHLSLGEAISRVFNSVLRREISKDELVSRLDNISLESYNTEVILDLIDELLKSDEFQRLHGPNTDFYKVTDSDIFYAFKFLLGRIPENQQVYENKKNCPSSKLLIEEIVISEEFKSNKILKNLISVRRRPKGFENLLNIESENTEKKILVISGCQGRMIADLLQAGTGVSYVENFFVNNDTLNQFVASKGGSLSNLIAWADLIFTQKRDIYRVLNENPETRHKARLIPIIEYIGFQPDQCYLLDRNSSSPIVGPLGEYHSTILAAAYFAGIDPESAIKFFNPDTYKAFGYHTLSHEAKQRLLEQETDTGYPLSDMFLEWKKTGRWMRTINHPKKFILRDLVKFAIAREGFSYISNSDEYVVDDLISNVDWPEYGADNEVEQHEINFKLPKVFCPNTNSAIFLTLHQYAHAFYSAMSGYSLDEISCQQLGRPIDLNIYIKYIKETHTQS